MQPFTGYPRRMPCTLRCVHRRSNRVAYSLANCLADCGTHIRSHNASAHRISDRVTHSGANCLAIGVAYPRAHGAHREPNSSAIRDTDCRSNRSANRRADPGTDRSANVVSNDNHCYIYGTRMLVSQNNCRLYLYNPPVDTP
jgi:hypothetical protein